jgi:hypothetical protein
MANRAAVKLCQAQQTDNGFGDAFKKQHNSFTFI